MQSPNHPGIAVPSGTVTFLFTDIEGSTKLLERLREQYAILLEAQRDILRAAFARWNGHEIDTQGDAFFAAFGKAIEAVNCVVDAQHELASHGWPQGVTVRVRMGLHTGEPIIARTGYVGMDVHRAARIAHAGHGGQVLLSQATRELVYQDLPPGVSLLDLGEHKLKDIHYPQRIYQLSIEGLPVEFPALKTLSSEEEPPTPGDDGHVRIWDAQTGGLVETLKGHTGVLEHVAFSPDEKLMAVGSEDGSLSPWDTASGALLRTIPAHRQAVRSLAFSPDGKRLATGSLDTTAKIRDISTGKELFTHSNNTTPSSPTAGQKLLKFSQPGETAIFNGFSPDGRIVYVGDYFGHKVRFYILPLEDLVSLAESRLTRTWMAEECQRYRIETARLCLNLSRSNRLSLFNQSAMQSRP